MRLMSKAVNSGQALCSSFTCDSYVMQSVEISNEIDDEKYEYLSMYKLQSIMNGL